MARFEVQEGQLQLVFSSLEVLGGLRQGASVPLAQVESVQVAAEPWSILEGLRVGTGMPWVIVLGTMLRRGANDVVAVYGRKPVVVVQLKAGAPWQRLIATVEEPEAVASRLQRAVAEAG
jgi:hypothetical protein